MILPGLVWLRVVLSLVCTGVAAQTPATPSPSKAQEKAEPKRSEEMKAFVDRAFSIPPEFSADLLLKLAGSSLIAEKKWKLDLIEEAFRTAPGAPSPYPKGGYMLPVESVISRQNDGNYLDQMTLRLRAVELMLELDAPRARAMFEEIVFPTLPSETCDEPLKPEARGYYETAGKVFARTFSATERRKGRDLLFLEQLIAPLHSHAQVGPLLIMILKASVSAPDRQRLLAQFAARLEHTGGGDRVFGRVSYVLAPVPDQASAAAFVPAFRQYLVRQTGGPRCRDNIPKKGVLPEQASRFNELIAKVDPAGTQFKPITLEESTPRSDEGTYPRESFSRSAYGDKVLAAIRSLRVPSGGGMLEDAPLEQRQTLEWKTRFQDTLRLVDEWPEAGEKSRDEYALRVAGSFDSLADMAPTPELRDHLMERYLVFVESHYAEIENRNVWYSLVRNRLWRGDNVERQASWLSRLARSPNPIIGLYAQFELMVAANRKNSVRSDGATKGAPASAK